MEGSWIAELGMQLLVSLSGVEIHKLVNTLCASVCSCFLLRVAQHTHLVEHVLERAICVGMSWHDNG